MSGKSSYFPALLCTLCDSPIDALVALCVPRDEAMDLVAASWNSVQPSDQPSDQTTCLLATLDGGRTVAALRTEQGRWAACHAFHELACTTRRDAERALSKLLKRGRRGYVGVLPSSEKKPAQD